MISNFFLHAVLCSRHRNTVNRSNTLNCRLFNGLIYWKSYELSRNLEYKCCLSSELPFLCFYKSTVYIYIFHGSSKLFQVFTAQCKNVRLPAVLWYNGICKVPFKISTAYMYILWSRCLSFLLFSNVLFTDNQFNSDKTGVIYIHDQTSWCPRLIVLQSSLYTFTDDLTVYKKF